MDHQAILSNLRPAHDYFIGIDSDGCVFDTMEVKQKEFFIPNALRHFGLFPAAKTVRETWEFVNLYSVHRGVNRFPALIKVFEMLSDRKEVIESGCILPDLGLLRKWIVDESKLSNATLRTYFNDHPDPGLEKVLLWSESVNKEIGEWLRGMSPFPHSRKCLERISLIADSIVVSQTPLEALTREWEEHNLSGLVGVIAGQEHGTKSEHLALAAKGKYPDSNILMIGDAKGDLDVALQNGVLFYPVIPGREDLSWERLLNEGLDKFVSGNFAGKYQEALIEDFKNSLPLVPPWEK